ncbi:MAG: hypothetical protein HY721_05740 [Planctomycetes bacterium]|nr:hypothetical protein [Planctomycetota bacterium]
MSLQDPTRSRGKLLALTLACAAAAAFAAALVLCREELWAWYALRGVDRVWVVRKRSDVKLSRVAEARIVRKLSAVLESSSVRLERPFADPEVDWKAAERKGTFLLVAWSAPAEVTLLGGTRVRAAEVLVSFPERAWPPGLSVREGGSACGYTKYTPGALLDLVSLPEIGLRDEPPYSTVRPSTSRQTEP